MIHPDDVEDGEVLFDDGEDGQDIYDRLQETRYYDMLDMNKPNSTGRAPADFLYDPIGKDRE